MTTRLTRLARLARLTRLCTAPAGCCTGLTTPPAGATVSTVTRHLDDWQHRAACANPLHSPEWWFSKYPDDRARARQICAECPVRQECAAAADAFGETTGTWGGTDREPQAIRSRRRDVKVGVVERVQATRERHPEADLAELTRLLHFGSPASLLFSLDERGHHEIVEELTS